MVEYGVCTATKYNTGYIENYHCFVKFHLKTLH